MDKYRSKGTFPVSRAAQSGIDAHRRSPGAFLAGHAVGFDTFVKLISKWADAISELIGSIATMMISAAAGLILGLM